MSRFIASSGAGRPWLFAETYLEQTRPAPLPAEPYTLEQNWGMDYGLLWPHSQILGSDPAFPTSAEMFPRVDFWPSLSPKGGGRRAYISGVTRNASGAVLGGVTVQAFRTSDDAVSGEVVSDVGDGTYSVATLDDSGHYAVGYLDVATDVAGTTVNTLTGS